VIPEGSVATRRREESEGSEAGPAPGPDRASHLGFVAHEIRNPLSTALWTAELIGRIAPEERGGARGERLAALCLRALGRVRTLIEDHLLCERLDTGAHPVAVEPVALAEVLEAIRRRGAAGGAVLVERVEEGLVAWADRGLLERALEGVVAVAARDVAEVRLAAARRGGEVEIRVEGAIPGSLVDPMKGADPDPRGRGLALPTARRVAAALGGRLEVDGGAYRLTLRASPAP
jgi:signal transduction histidine kinase